MNHTLIVTVSASDILPEQESRYGIKVLPFSIVVDGKSYVERRDFTPPEFYQMMLEAHALPTHSQVTPMEFTSVYEQAEKDGYDSVIYISINSHGSGTFNSLYCQGQLSGRPPGSKLKIFCVDSFPIPSATDIWWLKRQKGGKRVSPEEIVSYCEDWAKKSTIFFTPFSLEYVRKSGRVSCAAAFVGGLMGLKPVITWVDGESKTLAKLRGEKLVVPTLAKMAAEKMVPKTDYCVVCGLRPEIGQQLAAEMEKLVGYPPAMITNAGPVIAINAGPDLVAVCIRDKSK